MAEPIKWDSKIILLKPETIPGTDAAPTGATNAMLMKEVEFRPMEGQDVSRNLEKPWQGADETFPTGLYASLTGTIEAVGSGTAGTAPAWSPALRMCGVAETVTAGSKVEYTPVTDGQESASIHFWIGPTRHILLFAKATAVGTFTAQGIPGIRFTFTGLFVTPADQARPAPVLTAFQVPQVATNANSPGFKIGAQAFVCREFSFDLGCTVEPRLAMGRESVLITGKKESISAQVEALPLATFNPFALAINRTRSTIEFTHGTVAGKIFKFEAPVATMDRLTGYANQQNVTEWPLKLTPLPVAGNDQWKITLT